jgi:hypothetical protein
LSHLAEATVSVALPLRLTKKTIAPTIRASPSTPPNTLPTVTPTGAAAEGVDDEDGDDVVVGVEDEGDEEAVRLSYRTGKLTGYANSLS